MRSWCLLASLVGSTVACAPPDPITGLDTDPGAAAVPEIRILFPPSDAPITLDSDGFLRTLVVVDLINIDFLAPTGEENADGEGHYHLFVQETQYIEAPEDLFFELESDAFTAGQRGIINVDLRQNDHSELSEALDDCICTAQIEFAVEAP